MFGKYVSTLGLLASVVLSNLALAQGRDRAEIRVLNDWDNSVTVTILAERREEMLTRTWDFAPGESSFLGSDATGDRRARVRGTDRISIRSGSRGVVIGDVARFRDGHWFARVRDIYQVQRARDKEAAVSPGGAAAPTAPPAQPGMRQSNTVQLAGDWICQDGMCRIQQSGENLIFTNKGGESSSGRFVPGNMNRVVAENWERIEGRLGMYYKGARLAPGDASQLGLNIVSEILWANGAVWTRVGHEQAGGR